jgi:hypothetical protein
LWCTPSCWRREVLRRQVWGLWLDLLHGRECQVCGERTKYPITHALVNHPGELPIHRKIR